MAAAFQGCPSPLARFGRTQPERQRTGTAALANPVPACGDADSVALKLLQRLAIVADHLRRGVSADRGDVLSARYRPLGGPLGSHAAAGLSGTRDKAAVG